MLQREEKCSKHFQRMAKRLKRKRLEEFHPRSDADKSLRKLVTPAPKRENFIPIWN